MEENGAGDSGLIFDRSDSYLVDGVLQVLLQYRLQVSGSRGEREIKKRGRDGGEKTEERKEAES